MLEFKGTAMLQLGAIGSAAVYTLGLAGMDEPSGQVPQAGHGTAAAAVGQ